MAKISFFRQADKEEASPEKIVLERANNMIKEANGFLRRSLLTPRFRVEPTQTKSNQPHNLTISLKTRSQSKEILKLSVSSDQAKGTTTLKVLTSLNHDLIDAQTTMPSSIKREQYSEAKKAIEHYFFKSLNSLGGEVADKIEIAMKNTRNSRISKRHL